MFLFPFACVFLYYSIVFIFFQHNTTLANKKDRATGSPLLGLLICYEIAQKGAKKPLKMQK